jgi:hypothetical protein
VGVLTRGQHQPKPQLVLPIGDSLREPFWVEATGVTKGFHSALNAVYVANRWAQVSHGDGESGRCIEKEATELLSDCTRLFCMMNQRTVKGRAQQALISYEGCNSDQADLLDKGGPDWLLPRSRFKQEALEDFGFERTKLRARSFVSAQSSPTPPPKPLARGSLISSVTHAAGLVAGSKDAQGVALNLPVHLLPSSPRASPTPMS